MTWVSGLHMLLTQIPTSSTRQILELSDWLQSVWCNHASDTTQPLDLETVTRILCELNLGLREGEVKGYSAVNAHLQSIQELELDTCGRNYVRAV